MGYMTRHMPMATFIRDYAAVLDETETDGNDVVLERRGGRASFVVAPLDRVAADRQAVETLAGVLGKVLDLDGLSAAVVTSLRSQYPWVSFLPESERLAFERELLDTLAACASIGRFTAFEHLIDSWAATAAIYSDPELARALSGPIVTPEGSDVPAPANA